VAPFQQLFAVGGAAYTPAFMPRPSNLSGIAAMLAGTASFVVGDSFMKLVTSDLPPFEVLFLRGVAASLACGLLLLALGDWRFVSSALHPRALMRAAGDAERALLHRGACSNADR
jgi:drug/metabolite transporter (DMT)-like permease